MWRDGARTVAFGRDALARADELLPDGYVLLSTPRAAAAVPRIVARARAVHHVPPGRVDELAGELLGADELASELLAAGAVGGELAGADARGSDACDAGATAGASAGLIVALGGGRVIDTAKALAAATGARAAAIPTTLSGAEMTGIHRQARGADPARGFARPVLVLNDPALSASQPDGELAASALNALGHAAEAPLSTGAHPLATLAALAAARLLVAALAPAGEPDREALALGSLLAGYGIDQAGYGLHHVLSQTLARFTRAGHGAANAVMLRHSLRALRKRFPEELAMLDDALGGPSEQVAGTLAARAGATRLRELGVAHEELARCAAAAAARRQLELTPPRADAGEIGNLYEAAW